MLSLLVSSALYMSIFSFKLTLRSSGPYQSLRTEEFEQCLQSLRTEGETVHPGLLCKHMLYLAASPSRDFPRMPSRSAFHGAATGGGTCHGFRKATEEQG